MDNKFAILLKNGFNGSLSISGMCDNNDYYNVLTMVSKYCLLPIDFSVIEDFIKLSNSSGSIGYSSNPNKLNVIISLDKKEVHTNYSVFHISKVLKSSSFEITETRYQYLLTKTIM